MAMTGEEIHDWLNNAGLLPEHNRDASFADLLKDGISLCRLINRIKPGSVVNISTGYLPENAQQNIERFIQACKSLGIQESFVPSDLLEMRDFDQVLNTLQALHQYCSAPTTRNNQKSSQSSADDEGTQCVVKAMYNFTGTGDDELSFQKGDLIMVTKVVEGGWWEGILNDQVGWFPGNHVEEISPAESSFQGSKESSDTNRDSLQRYYDLVVKDIIDSEETYVSELMTLISVYLTPLKTADVLPSEEVCHLTGNLPTLAAAQDKFFKRLKEMVKLPAGEQMIASLFMDVSSEMERLYTAYVTNHPRAVAILTDNSDKLSAFMESKGAPIPGMLMLTQNLSKPMRRLEKYPTLLEELQRHTQDDHKDKSKVESGVNFYSSLLTNTQEVRKKKEAEYEMLSNPVKGYAGKCLMELGECSCVVTGSEVISAEIIDERFYLVFPGVLVILAVGQSLSGYELQYKFPLSSITVRKTQDEENFVNAIEIVYNNNKSIQTSITTLKDMKLLLETVAANGSAVDPSKVDVGKVPTGEAPAMQSVSHSTSRYSMQHRRQNSTPVVRQRFWGFKSLRPAPPLHASQIMQIREEKDKDKEKVTKSHKAFINVTTTFKRRSKLEEVHATAAAIERVAPDSVQATSHGGDTAVLRVIEAYCLGSRMKQASMLDRPIATSVIPIRQVPSAPPVYTLPRHASTSHLDQQKRPASPKKNRRFSFMPGKKDTNQSFIRSPLRHSLRELSSHKKQQSGSLPDFTQFTAGGKNKNMNHNNSNNVDKNNLAMVVRVPVTPQLPKPNSNDNNNNNNTDDDDDLIHTQSETSLTASSSVSLGDGNLEQSTIQRRSSSSDNLRTSNNGKEEKPRLRDSAEGVDHKHFIVRGLCLGSYSLFHKGGNK